MFSGSVCPVSFLERMLNHLYKLLKLSHIVFSLIVIRFAKIAACYFRLTHHTDKPMFFPYNYKHIVTYIHAICARLHALLIHVHNLFLSS